MRNSVLFGAGSYSIDSTVFQGPDLIKNDKKRKRVEKAFAKQKATLEQLHDSFKLEYGKHKSKTPSSVDEYMPDFVKIHFTMPDGKPAQEEISRGGFNWTYGSLVRKAMSRAQELSDYFHPKVKDDQKAKEDKGKS